MHHRLRLSPVSTKSVDAALVLFEALRPGSRQREQWRLLAEGAPDDATADYLHAYFEPTARATDGLEKALAGLGLLEDALALDMRKPQDYFHRIWSVAFRATDLAAQVGRDADEDTEEEACA